MPATKVRFHFVYKVCTDKNTTIIKNLIDSSGDHPRNLCFSFTVTVDFAHAELSELPIIESALKSFTKRNLYCYVNITLSDNMVKIHFDAEGNTIFEDECLKEQFESDNDDTSSSSC